MILPDVNVLILAFHREAEEHQRYKEWLESALTTQPIVGISDYVLSSVTRICTHPRIYSNPSPLNDVLAYCNSIRSLPNVVRVVPGPRHWEIFQQLCDESGAQGNLVADAFLAALAIEVDADWISTDRDFAKFPGLRWRHPFDS